MLFSYDGTFPVPSLIVTYLYDDVRQEIEKVDYSNWKKDNYRLGMLALQDTYDEFGDLYINQKLIGKEEILEYPIFKNIRKTEKCIEILQLNEKEQKLLNDNNTSICYIPVFDSY